MRIQRIRAVARHTARLAMAAALAFTAAPVSAQIYDNGTPNGANAYEMTLLLHAQDFTLDGSNTIGAVRFWALATRPYSYQGSIYYSFLSNSGGQPGAVLQEGLAIPAVTELGIHQGGGNDLQLDFSVTPLNLGAGVFWLALHNGPQSTTEHSEFYWVTTNPNGTLGGLYDIAPFDGNWTSGNPELAFQLYGPQQVVPEPVSMALLGTGLLGLGAARRRQKRGLTDNG